MTREETGASVARRQLPEAPPGFGHIRRYWDKPHEAFAAKLLPGEFYVTLNDELLTTVLGAGVAVCVRDADAGLAGMLHFLLPQEEGAVLGVAGGDPRGRYGDQVMSRLLDNLLKHGARADRLEFKVFGGAQAFAETADLARRTIAFTQGWLRDRGHRAAAEDLGGPFPRKLIYHPTSGLTRVKKLRELDNDTLARRDRDHLRSLSAGRRRG